jgi:hypothetical protein
MVSFFVDFLFYVFTHRATVGLAQAGSCEATITLTIVDKADEEKSSITPPHSLYPALLF